MKMIIPITSAALECPAAMYYSMQNARPKKIPFMHHGSKVDELVENLLLSVIDSVPDKTVTIQLDLSIDLNVKHPITGDRIYLRLVGKPDIIINEVQEGRINNKIIEVKYYPSDDLPVASHIRQVSMYSFMYERETGRKPDTFLQYYLTHDEEFIKKLIIENADKYPNLPTNFVKNVRIRPEMIEKSVRETLFNVARAIVLQGETSLGVFDCAQCPYAGICKVAPNPVLIEFFKTVNYDNMLKNRFNVKHENKEVSELAVATVKTYLEMKRQLNL